MVDRPQLIVPLEQAEKAIAHSANTGNDINFGSWADPKTEERAEKWANDTQEMLAKIFSTTEMAERFIDNVLDTSGTTLSEQEKHNLSLRGTWENRLAWIRRLQEEIGIYKVTTSVKMDALQAIELIGARFHTVARQLRQRHGDRNTLDISDEYDVQDLLHALLRVFFDDIREEEYSPSYAGGASRIDFVLKTEKIVIEVKKTRPSLKAKELGEELIIDIAKYQTHQDCKMLYCFVYDPDGYIRNPQGIENDLSRSGDPFPVKVFIAPKTY